MVGSFTKWTWCVAVKIWTDVKLKDVISKAWQQLVGVPGLAGKIKEHILLQPKCPGDEQEGSLPALWGLGR